VTEQPTRSGWRKLLPNVWVAVIAPIIVGLAIVGIPALISALTSSEKKPGPEIEAASPVVHNAEAVFEDAPDVTDPETHEPAMRQSQASKAQVEIRLQNNGNRQAYFASGVITVRKEIVMPPCGQGSGGLMVSGTYDVPLLRRRDAQGQTIEFPINQVVDADDSSRFAFRIGPEFSDEDVGQTLFYQLDIAVQHGNETTGVGRVLLGFPGISPLGILPVDIAHPKGCDRETVAALRQVARLRGVRSPELQRVLDCFKEGTSECSVSS